MNSSEKNWKVAPKLAHKQMRMINRGNAVLEISFSGTAGKLWLSYEETKVSLLKENMSNRPETLGYTYNIHLLSKGL